MESNLLYGLIFAGVIQGLILSIFILFTKHKTRASKFLGLLILFTTLTILQDITWEIGLVNGLEYYLIFLPYPYACAGLQYFFVMTFLYPNRKNTSTEKSLFLPFYIILVVILISKLCYLILDINHPIIEDVNTIINTIDRYGDLLNVALVTIVLIMLWKSLKKYHEEPDSYHSGIFKSKLSWLKTLLILQFIFIVFWGYSATQFALTDNFDYSSDLLLVATSVLIYIMGYIGTQKIRVQEERKQIRLLNFSEQDYPISNGTKNKHIFTLEEILIKERKFLDQTITLSKLAEELQLSKSHLSRIINSELNMSFSEYVNSLRVNEAKKLIINPAFSKYTLVSIGLEAGFNSKTTFNNTFKKLTGQTPSQFRRNPSN